LVTLCPRIGEREPRGRVAGDERSNSWRHPNGLIADRFALAAKQPSSVSTA